MRWVPQGIVSLFDCGCTNLVIWGLDLHLLNLNLMGTGGKIEGV